MTYTIQPGDTLYTIAQRFGVALNELIAANPQIVDPSLIYPGQQITIPVPGPHPTGEIYVVRPGDTLYAIARRYGITLQQLLAANPQIVNPNQIYPGQQILIPTAAPAVPPGCVVYVSDRTGRADLWRSSAAGEGAVQITRESGTLGQPVSNPRWSPDGRFIAYQAVGGLFAIDPCGRNPILLAAEVDDYSWSNDSTRIAFSNSEGVFIVDLDGNTRKVIEGLTNPVWFPGDMRLAASVPETDGIRFARLATVDVSGENLRVLESVPARNIRLSPNGRYAGTQFFRGSAFGIFSTVYIYDFDTGNLVTLPGLEFEVEPEVVRDVSFLGGWAPGSSLLVYSTLLNENGLGEIRIVDTQGNVRQRFRREFYPFPDWGPVADWIIYTVSEQPGVTVTEITIPRDIYVLNIATNRELRVAGPADAYSPDWSGRACPPC